MIILDIKVNETQQKRTYSVAYRQGMLSHVLDFFRYLTMVRKLHWNGYHSTWYSNEFGRKISKIQQIWMTGISYQRLKLKIIFFMQIHIIHCCRDICFNNELNHSSLYITYSKPVSKKITLIFFYLFFARNTKIAI